MRRSASRASTAYVNGVRRWAKDDEGPLRVLGNPRSVAAHFPKRLSDDEMRDAAAMAGDLGNALEAGYLPASDPTVGCWRSRRRLSKSRGGGPTAPRLITDGEEIAAELRLLEDDDHEGDVAEEWYERGKQWLDDFDARRQTWWSGSGGVFTSMMLGDTISVAFGVGAVPVLGPPWRRRW